MTDNEDFSILTAALLFSLAVAWAVHLFFPMLPAVLVGFIAGYNTLQSEGKYGSNYNLLLLLVAGVGLASPLFFELNPIQAIAFIYAFVLLFMLKILFKITGFSLKSQFTNPQIGAMRSAIKSKSIIGFIVSLLNIQNVAIFAFFALAIFPLVILDLLIYFLFGISTNRIFIYLGTFSLGMVAIVLDIKDVVKLKTGEVKAKFSSDPEPLEVTSEETAREVFQEIDSELPPLEDVTWTRRQLRELNNPRFYQHCIDVNKKDANDEDLNIDQIEPPEPFGYCSVFTNKSGNLQFLDFGRKKGENGKYCYEGLAESIRTFLAEHQLNPKFVVVSIDIKVNREDKIKVFSEYGLLMYDVDFLRREFYEHEVRA